MTEQEFMRDVEIIREFQAAIAWHKPSGLKVFEDRSRKPAENRKWAIRLLRREVDIWLLRKSDHERMRRLESERDELRRLNLELRRTIKGLASKLLEGSETEEPTC